MQTYILINLQQTHTQIEKKTRNVSTLAPERQRWAGYCKFEANLIYTEFHASKNYITRPCLKKHKMLGSGGP